MRPSCWEVASTTQVLAQRYRTDEQNVINISATDYKLRPLTGCSSECRSADARTARDLDPSNSHQTRLYRINRVAFHELGTLSTRRSNFQQKTRLWRRNSATRRVTPDVFSTKTDAQYRPLATVELSFDNTLRAVIKS